MAKILDAAENFLPQYEPKVKFRYILYMPGMVASYIVKSASRPKIKMNSYKIDYMNGYRNYAGKGEWDPMPVDLFDPISPSGSQMVMDWMRLCYDFLSGKAGYSDVYKKDITLNMISPQNEVIEEWVLHGAFIEDADFGKVDYSASEAAEISLSIKYDYADLKF